MENLIKALQILLVYGNPEYPTHCEHDVMYIDISPSKVSEHDLKQLEALGFYADSEEDDMFRSYKYGSC